MDPNNGVYDKDDHEPVTRPDLLGMEEGKTGNEDGGGLFKPDGDDDKKDKRGKDSVDGKSLGQAEEAGLPGERLGKGYRGERAGAESAGDRLLTALRNPKNRRKGLIIGGASGGLATLLVIGTLFVGGLRIETLMNGIQQHFGAATEYAVSDETENIFSSYIVDHVLPSYKGCGTTISKDCSVNNIVGTNPVDNLYRTWANARLENKLAEDYGIEFKYDKASKSWFLKAPGLSSEGEKIGENGEELSALFKRSDQAALRGALSDALENETKWKEVLLRFKYGRLLEEKYGVKRCVIFCGTRDALQNHSNEKKNAAQIFLTQRVLIPRTDTLGIVMECLLDTNCDAESTQPTAAEDGTSGELAGEAENAETDTAVRTNLTELANSYGITDDATVEGMIKDYNNIEEKGYSNYALEAVLEKVGLSEFSDNITDTAPLIGWVNAAASIITDVDKSGPTVEKLGFITNSAAAVAMYEMYSSYVSEIHTGHIDATEEGSMNDSFNGGTSGSNQIGGTASAEQTPLYGYISGANGTSSGGSSSVSLLNSLMPTSTTYADSLSSDYSNYKCKDGKTVPTGKLVCAENDLGGGNAALNSVHSALNTPPFNAITSIAGVWNSVPGKILGFFGSLFGSAFEAIPGMSGLVHDASSFVANVAQPFFTFATDKLIQDPFAEHMSGGQNYVDTAMGGDASYSTYGQTGLGGRALSTSEVTAIDDQETNEEQEQFSHQSIFARLFDTNSTYSLISKVAVDMPTSLQSGAEGTFSSIITKPLSLLSTSFGDLFSSKVNALSIAGQSDPFGITPYGYTQADLDSIGDASTYWDEHCSNNASQAYENNDSWNEQAAQTTDPNTGMPENTTTNPCLLIEATSGSDGAIYNTSLLTSDDLADDNSSSSTTPTSSSGNAQQLAQQILSNPNIDLSCLSSSVQQDVQDAANNQPGTAGAMTKASILQLIQTIGQSHKVCVTAIQSDGQGHCDGEPKTACPNDPHYNGDAVDFGSLDGASITGRNAPALTIMQIAESVIPSGSFGQSQCGSTPTLPSGWSDFQDTCNHLHVQDVPAGSP
jgi:hypothetical protein